jgi:hypothetical protein
VVASCGSSSQTTTVEDPVPTTLSITPTVVAFSFLTESRALQADVRDQNGSAVAATVTWSTSDASVVSIDAAGVAAATGNGSATITATAAGLTATLTIQVQQVPRILVAQQGDDQDAIAGTALADTIVMRLTDLAGSPVEGVTVVFTPDATAGTVSVDSVVTGVDGLASTVWTLGSEFGPQSLLVTAADLETTLESFSRSATPIADLLFNSAISLSRNDPSVLDSLIATATIRNQGDLDTGGPFRLQARVGGVEVAFVDVPALAPAEEVQVQLQLPPLPAGAQSLELVLDPAGQLAELIETNNVSQRSLQVLAQASLSTGVPATGLSATLGQEILFILDIPPGAGDALNISISDASIGPNDDLDLFVAQGRRPSFREDYPDCVSAGPSTVESCQIVFPEGTYHILLHAWEDPAGQAVRTGFTDVTLTATLSNSIVPFGIEIVILDNGTPTQDQAFLDAAARWETIIRGDVPDRDFAQDAIPADACFEGQPAISDVIDDVRIYVQIQPIDQVGGTLAQAGPCLSRPITSLPLFGLMTFDEADLTNLEGDGDMLPVVLHEMGHVLGIGTMWDDKDLLQAPSLPNNQGADTHFRGDGAIEAFDAAGGSSYSGAKVPVENQAGEGSGDSHWRESVLQTELMTPFLRPGTFKALSAITVRSLEDLGYGVDVTSADAYSLPAFPALRVAPPTGRMIDLTGDTWVGPRIRVDSKGRIVEIRR